MKKPKNPLELHVDFETSRHRIQGRPPGAAGESALCAI